MSFSLRKRGRRHAINPMHVTITVSRNPTKKGPRPDCVNECTDDTMPLRVRKVPKIVSVNVNNTSTMFHIFSMFFFS